MLTLSLCHVCSLFSSVRTDGDSRVGGDQQSGLLSLRVLQDQPGSGRPSQVKAAPHCVMTLYYSIRLGTVIEGW